MSEKSGHRNQYISSILFRICANGFLREKYVLCLRDQNAENNKILNIGFGDS